METDFDIRSFIYGIIGVVLLVLLLVSFGYAHIGSSAISGAVTDGNGDMPEKCRQPAGQDLNSWKEHLGHHAETRECLQYFN